MTLTAVDISLASDKNPRRKWMKWYSFNQALLNVISFETRSYSYRRCLNVTINHFKKKALGQNSHFYALDIYISLMVILEILQPLREQLTDSALSTISGTDHEAGMPEDDCAPCQQFISSNQKIKSGGFTFVTGIRSSSINSLWLFSCS